MAIWNLRTKWDVNVPTVERLRRVREEMHVVGDFQSVIDELSGQGRQAAHAATSPRDLFEDIADAVSF
jgi:hypothetical protein